MIHKIMLIHFLILLICLSTICQVLPQDSVFNPGLLFSDGIEPGIASEGEAPEGNSNWYVDADVPDGGDGSYENPFNSFEEVVGYTNESSGGYVTGLLRGGDYLYVKGTFRASDHEEGINNTTIHMARAIQGGTIENPTVIKRWKGFPRAIFDGESTMMDLITIRWFDNQKIVIQNVEIYRPKSRGLLVGERVRYADVISVLAHNGVSDGILGTGGGITFKMIDSLHEFTLSHSVIHDNIQTPIGGPACGVHILSEGWIDSNSTITLFNNIVYNEFAAIGHKHSGAITMNAYHNLIYNSRWGFSLRAFHQNRIHHNVIINTDEAAFYFSKENLQGDFSTDIYNNTIVNCNGAIGTTSDQSDFGMDINFYDNIYYSTDFENVISLARWASNYFDINGWHSSKKCL